MFLLFSHRKKSPSTALGKNMSESDNKLSLLSCSISFHSQNNHGAATVLEEAQGGWLPAESTL